MSGIEPARTSVGIGSAMSQIIPEYQTQLLEPGIPKWWMIMKQLSFLDWCWLVYHHLWVIPPTIPNRWNITVVRLSLAKAVLVQQWVHNPHPWLFPREKSLLTIWTASTAESHESPPALDAHRPLFQRRDHFTWNFQRSERVHSWRKLEKYISGLCCWCY